MAKWWTTAVLVVVLGESLASPLRAQGPLGAFGPPGPGPQVPPLGAFGPPPSLLEGPQFCPDPKPPGRALIPFQDPRPPLTNGFSETGNCEEDPCGNLYFALGTLGLVRQGLGHGVLAVADKAPSDNAALPPLNAFVVLNFVDIQPRYTWGIRATCGVSEGPHALEVTGYYLFNQNARLEKKGRLDLPFGAFPAPAGFNGNNNLWLQADRALLTLSTEIGTVEFNYRYRAYPWIEWIAGLRYFDLEEGFSVRTDDEFTIPPRPLVSATYAIRTQNRILGPQVGCETFQQILPPLACGLFAKGMVGANFVDVDHRLIRGDGLQGPGGLRHPVITSYLLEFGLVFDFCLNDHMRLRAGYQGLCVGNVPEAHAQINFDTRVPTGRSDNHGFILFHGPLIEFQVAF